MKKLLIVLLSFASMSTFAQSGHFDNTQIGQNFKGFMVTVKHDTIKCSFHIWTQNIMQLGCQADDLNGNSLWGNSYANTITYQIENNTKWYSSMLTTLKAPADPKRPGGGTESFLLCQEVGPITLFDYNFVDEMASPPTSKITTYMQLPNGDVVDISSLLLGFAKKMSGYVKDYPELAAKITNKEKGYGLLNINSIVREYNAWYMSKNPDLSIIKK
jgi:hypothetical protein